MIRLEELTVRAGSFRLDGVSLDVPSGGYGLVVGPTGAGKTTLLEAIAGHAEATSGRVVLSGRDVTHQPPEARGIGFVYQAYHLFPHLTVRENIGYGLARARAGRQTIGSTERVEELAELLALGSLLDRSVRGLSGGEQQRVALARALAPRPAILLLDEPLAAVDPSLRRTLRRVLLELREREGVTTLHVTHDVDDALRLGDLVAVLSAGRVVQAGPPDQVFRYPATPFVADLLGSGNTLRGTVTRTGESSGHPARFPALFECGRLRFEVVAEREGEAHILVRPEDLLVSTRELPDYPRNRLPATVSRLVRLGPVVMVHLEIEGETMVASVTTATAEEQQLATGVPVTVGLKATAVHLF